MKMQSKILTMALAPLLGMGLAIILFGNVRITEVVTESIENEAPRASAVSVRDTLDYADAGEYQLQEDILFKGDFNVSAASQIADNLRKAADTDITIFYGDTRYMTSVLDEQGERVIGTKAGDAVIQKVLKNGQEHFATNVDVVGKPYFGYYLPLYQSGSEEIIGMVFAGMPQQDAEAQISKIISLIAAIMILVIILCAVLIFFVVHRMVKALHQGTQSLELVAQGKLNFEVNEKILKRKDEIGIISRAIFTVKTELQDILSSIKQQNDTLNNSSEDLNAKAITSAEHIVQLERAVEEIAQGAGNQAEETQSATQNVIEMGNLIEDTTAEVGAMNESAKLIKSLGHTAIETLHDLEQINRKTLASIDVIYEQTNTTNTSAQKIKEATVLIAEIAEQTNLLSLNASIEAARAGENGRGFAVVASQIQKLAEQSNDSAQQIDDIINSLLSDSEKAVKTMDDVKNIMGTQSENVTKTDEQVTQVITQVEQSLEAIERIVEQTASLNEARANVTDTVQNLTAVAEENAASTEESAASVNQVSEIIQGISQIAKQQKEIVALLNQHVQKFEV